MRLDIKNIFLVSNLRYKNYLKGKGGRVANIYLGIVKM